MNYSLKIKLLELTQRALMVRADAQPDNGDKWRTTETGSKILLGKDGTVKGGMGGKFNGKNIKEVGGTKKFTKYQTNKEREQGNEPLKQHIGTEKLNNLHNGKAVKFYFNDPRTNKEVSATIKRDMVYDVPTYILSGNGANRRVDEENIINMFERGEYRNEPAKQTPEPVNLVEAKNKTSNNLTKENERGKLYSPSQTEAGKSGDNKMSINIQNPVYDVTLGLSKTNFGMQELKKVIKESGDEAGIIFATNYVEKNMANNPLGAKELLNFANKKTKKAAKEKAKLEKEEAAKVAETQAQEQITEKYFSNFGGLEGAKAYALSAGITQETIDRAFTKERLASKNNIAHIKGKLFDLKKAGKGDLEIIEKAKENLAKKAEKEQNEKEWRIEQQR